MNHMEFQEDLFALARNSDPSTSHQAAMSITGEVLVGVLNQVLAVIQSFGEHGCISDQVLAALDAKGLKYGTITPRYRQLLNKGWIVDTGEQRPASSGRKQRVMKAVTSHP